MDLTTFSWGTATGVVGSAIFAFLVWSATRSGKWFNTWLENRNARLEAQAAAQAYLLGKSIENLTAWTGAIILALIALLFLVLTVFGMIAMALINTDAAALLGIPCFLSLLAAATAIRFALLSFRVSHAASSKTIATMKEQLANGEMPDLPK